MTAHEREIDYVVETLKPLEDGTITWVGVSEDEDGVWPTFQVRTTGGDVLQVEVSRDPEGNGPGHLFIGPIPAEAVR